MSEKKKILVFADWFEPGYKAGGPIRSVANLVKRMGDDFDFYILTSDRDVGDSKAYDGIELNNWLDKENFHVKYVPVEYMTSENIKFEIESLEIKTVYLNSLFSKFFALIPLKSLKKWDGDIILAPRGMLGKGSLQVKALKKKVFLQVAKITGLYKNITWHATNESEKQEIIDVFGKQDIEIVPNMGLMPQFDLTDKIKKQKGVLELVFFARIHPIKNLLFCFDILSNINEGEIVFTIIGPIEDKDYWEQCKKVILPTNIKIQFLGLMTPKELKKELPNFHVLFLPTKNENFGHSIVEAFSYGCPVIISDQTPWRELKKKGIGADIALSDKEEYISEITRFLKMDQTEYSQHSKNSFDFASQVIKNKETQIHYNKLFNKG